MNIIKNMSRPLHKILTFTFLAIIAFLSYYCANPRPPSGGPKDVYPPSVLKTVPNNYSRNFTGDRIHIYFDEFVKLNDVANQIFISPPQYTMPEFTSRGKSIIIEFQDELLENTTYNIFFGESIVDITESNPLDNYSFVFSTGNKIDSLVVLGEVRNAFNFELEPEVLVMLYDEHYDTIPADSAPYLVRPVYVSRTYDDGKFALISLKEGNYRLFALKDINKNFLFDLPAEHIAYWDTLITPFYPETLVQADSLADSLDLAAHPDSMREDLNAITIGHDTIGLVEYPGDTLAVMDTLVGDTLVKDQDYPYYQLMLFHEVDSTQRLADADFTQEKLLTFVFRYPSKNPLIESINREFNNDSIIDEWSPKMDTLKRWLLAVPHDSALFKVMDDTLVLDTVDLPLRKSERQGLFSRKEEKPTNPLKFKNNIKGGKLDYPKPLKLFFTYPLISWDSSNVTLITPKDTLLANVKMEDTLVRRAAEISYDWKEKTAYTVLFDDSTMTDIIGRQNDSLALTFTTKSLEDYGILFVSITLPGDSLPYIIQLLNEDEKIIRQHVIYESCELTFDLLKPMKYKLKAIRDDNRNGRWDTGSYLKGLQPEKVYYFIKLIDVRANWELEEYWVVE